MSWTGRADPAVLQTAVATLTVWRPGETPAWELIDRTGRPRFGPKVQPGIGASVGSYLGWGRARLGPCEPNQGAAFERIPSPPTLANDLGNGLAHSA